MTERVLVAALLLGALGLIAKSFIRMREVPPGPFAMRSKDRTAAVAIGLVGGFQIVCYDSCSRPCSH